MRTSDLRRSCWGLAVGGTVGVLVLLAGCEGQLASQGPQKAPADTGEPAKRIVLFDGTDASGWVTVGRRARPIRWKVEDGVLVCAPRTGSIRTKQTFGDHKLHIEFRVPHMPDAQKGTQARGNSGVFLQGRYEVQVLDSHDIGRPIRNDDCGALYKLITPSKNACKPPNEWQTYDITFRAPKFDKDGRQIKKGRLTVVQNGITIIDDKEIPGTTAGGVDEDPKKRGLQYHPSKPGTLMLQDHGNTVAFRNIWVEPLE